MIPKDMFITIAFFFLILQKKDNMTVWERPGEIGYDTEKDRKFVKKGKRNLSPGLANLYLSD